jgi:hypothetical protein
MATTSSGLAAASTMKVRMTSAERTCRQIRVDGQTNRQTERQAGRHADRQTGRQAGRQTDKGGSANRVSKVSKESE